MKQTDYIVDTNKKVTAIQLLNKFINWAKYCGEDWYYIFENTDEAINRFFKETHSSEVHNQAYCQTNVIGSFYYRDFGFENIEFQNTQDGTILIRCNSPSDLLTFEISKKESFEIALALLKNYLNNIKMEHITNEQRSI
jgi:hypothetical protein